MSRSRSVVLISIALAASAAAGLGEPPGDGKKLEDERTLAIRRQRKLTRFGFEGRTVLVPNRAPMPLGWERYLEYYRGAVKFTSRPLDDGGPLAYGPFPDYLEVKVMDLDRPGTPGAAVHGGRRSIRMQLAGTRDMDRVGIRRLWPLEVNPDFAYELTGWVRLDGVEKKDTYAQLRIEWLDKDGKLIGRPSMSDVVNRAKIADWVRKQGLKAAPAWVPTPEFRINDVDPRARSARVWCVASGRELGGYAYFDDIQVHRRPKVSVTPDQPNGIFAHGEMPALRLHFQGLAAGAGSRKVTGYRRVIRSVDAFGRAQPELVKNFSLIEARAGSIEDRVRLERPNSPGAYAVEIILEAQEAGGSRREVAKRVVRLVKMGQSSKRKSAAGKEMFGVDLDLYRPEAERLVGAARRCGISVLALPLWRRDSDPAQFRSMEERRSPEEGLASLLRKLTALRMHPVGVLAPVPDKQRPEEQRKAVQNFGGARTLYAGDPEKWKPLMDGTTSFFQPYLAEWRMAAADDASFGEPDVDRRKLAARLRDRLERAPSKVVTVPLRLADLPFPAAAIPGTRDRELIFVPAGVSPEKLAAQLAKLFPPAAAGAKTTPGAAGMSNRQWFLELPEVSENLRLDMEAELRQANDLARKIVLLARSGAERCFVKLADPGAGLLGPGLYPRPVYAAYSVLAAELSGARYLGEFDLASGAEAYAFEREGSGMVVFWTDGEAREAPCQLGARGQVQLVELTGARRRLRAPRNPTEARGLSDAEMVVLSKVPALLVGLEPAFVRTRLGFRLAKGSRLQARYQQQKVSFEIRNFFKESMEALVIPSFPRGSYTKPRFRKVDIEPGKSVTVEFSVRPSFVETVGLKEMKVDLRLRSGGRPEVNFTITRRLPVASAIILEPTVTVSEDGRTAEVRLQVGLSAADEYKWSAKKPERPYGLKSGGEKYDLEVSLAAPGGTRQRAQLRGVEAKAGHRRHPDHPFVVPLTDRSQTVYVGARLRGGPWFTNIEISLPPRKKP